MALNELEKRTLDRDGFLVLPQFMDRDLLTGLRERVEELFLQEGDQAVAEKQLLDRRVQDSLGPELRDLLALDDPLNDELSATATTRSGFLK